MRGYHIYRDIWATAVGEELSCQREVRNRVDTFAVAIISILYSRGANRSRQRSTGSWKDAYRLEIAIEGHLLGVAKQTAPRVGSSKFTGSKFRSSYFHEIGLGAKSTKISTMRKFPAIRYPPTPFFEQKLCGMIFIYIAFTHPLLEQHKVGDNFYYM